MKISIVATLYYSSAYIAEFCVRAANAARQVSNDYEIILVNDGSPDDSLAKAIAAGKEDSHIAVIDLSRNFGHHKAMMTGLAQASGDIIFLIDSDLEEEPEWLVPFFHQMQEKNTDVIYGVQETRKGSWFERTSGAWFYSIFNAISGLSIPRNAVTARLMSRRYVDALLLCDEREPFFPGLCYMVGFAQHPHSVHKHNTSKTTYTLHKKLRLCLTSVTSFSKAPLIAVLSLGLIISCTSLIYFLWLILNGGQDGWQILMASVWLVGGLVISSTGILGMYVSKVLSEVRRQPYTIIRHIYRSSS